MGVMRRVLFISLLVLGTFALLQANAGITVEEQTDADYIINNGYSEAMAEQILINKNRSNGQPAEPLYEQKHGKFVRFVRNVYGYLDPSQDTDERIHHDIHMSPNVRDL